jgi:hypothetical protein
MSVLQDGSDDPWYGDGGLRVTSGFYVAVPNKLPELLDNAVGVAIIHTRYGTARELLRDRVVNGDGLRLGGSNRQK